VNHTDWYVELKGQPHGPLSLDRIRELVQNGTIYRSTSLWQHPMLDWQPLHAIPELSGQVPPPLPSHPSLARRSIDRTAGTDASRRPPPVARPASGISAGTAGAGAAEALETAEEMEEAPEERPMFQVLEREEDVPADDLATHTWRRFFARFTDYSIFGVVMGYVVAAALVAMSPEAYAWLFESASSEWALGMLVIGLFVPVEAWILSRWGATPGKWLLSLRVEQKAGGGLTRSQARSRAGGVWVQGMAFGVPIITAITQLVAASKLQRNGEMSWDSYLGTAVRADAIEGRRMALLVVVLIIVGYYMWLGSLP
jgi:uncharacterized RDD family membrane protein YckC